MADEGRDLIQSRAIIIAKRGRAGVEIDLAAERADGLRHMQRFEIRDAGAQGIEDAVERVFRAAAMLRRVPCRMPFRPSPMITLSRQDRRPNTAACWNVRVMPSPIRCSSST